MCLTKQQGITLIEMMIAVAVLAILSAIATPGFKGLLAKNQLIDSVYSFISDLHLARSEAIKQEQHVALCPSSDGIACLGDFSQWARGYIVFVDSNHDDERSDNESLLGYFKGYDQTLTIQSTSSARKTIAFRASGRSSGYNTTVSFCVKDYAKLNRAVIISNTGRARVSREVGGGAVSCG